MNQCDGCQIRAPFNSWGHHVYPGGGLSGCTKHLYVSEDLHTEDEAGTLLISEKLNREQGEDDSVH